MPKLMYANFDQDLQSVAIRQIVDPSLLVFPSHAAATEARKLFQEQWRFEDIRFVSMEQLKNELILPPRAEMQDEKRLLSLWSVLKPEDRSSFHLYEYEDIITWGLGFFGLFEEMADELVSVEKLVGEFFNLHTREWQEEHLEKIWQIRMRYLEKIDEMGYTDRIFYLSADHIQIPFSPRRVIFVNQYYFSELEKRIVSELEAKGCEILILHQGLEDGFDLEKLQSKPITLEDVPWAELPLKQLNIIEAPDQKQMVLAFLNDFGARSRQDTSLSDDLRRALIDPSFETSPYKRWFDPRAFGHGQALGIQNSRLFQLLGLYGRHLQAVAAAEDSGFLPISEVARALAMPGFIQYYNPEAGNQEQEALLTELQRLALDSVLYIDPDLEVFGENDETPGLKELLQKHFAILQHLAKIDSLQALVDVFDTEGGLWLKRLCSTEELEHTEILGKFYERLDNFLSVERLGIISNWETVYEEQETRLAAKLWQFWLDSLASVSYSLYERPGRSLCEISNLYDSRNIRYDEVMMLNCVEGSMPSNPEAIWLFNENQRGKLGLKHYEQVRDWERYYFLRLIFGAQRVDLYSYLDVEMDIEPGSFLTELRHFLAKSPQPSLKFQDIKVQADAGLLAAAQKREQSWKKQMETSGLCGWEKETREDFYTLKCEPEKDFVHKGDPLGIYTAYYGLKTLSSNPFAWYIQMHKRIQERDLMPEETISPMLFGSILHDFLALTMGHKVTEHSGTQVLAAIFEDKENMKKEMIKLLNKDSYRFKIPQNYNREYLFEVILDGLVDSVSDFYHGWLQVNLEGKDFKLIPEAEQSTKEEQKDKRLLAFGDGKYGLNIHGRVDLRIETDDQDYVIDFKTREGADEQLMFYEYFYYLLSEEYAKELKSLFWLIVDAKVDKDNDKSKKRADWLIKLQELLDACLEKGYSVGRTAKDRKTLENVTRADLWQRSQGGES